MPRPIPLLTIWGGLLAIVLGAAGCWTTGDVAAGPDIPRLFALVRAVEREQARGDQLDAEIVASLDRLESKQAIARALVAQRLTLLEAVAHFRALDAGSPCHASRARLYHAGLSEDERLYRQVMIHAQSLLDKQPEEAARLTIRLEAELREYLHGQVCDARPWATASRSKESDHDPHDPDVRRCDRP